MTSRKHLVRKHNKLLGNRDVRGFNVPDSRLNSKELKARRELEALGKRIEAKDKRIDINKKPAMKPKAGIRKSKKHK